MTAEFDGGLAKPQDVHGRNYDACDRQLSRNVVPTCAEYLAHHRRPAVPGARDVEIFKFTPRQKSPQISPILIADKITLHVSREKDGKLRVVYAGWDDFNVVQPDGFTSSRASIRAF